MKDNEIKPSFSGVVYSNRTKPKLQSHCFMTKPRSETDSGCGHNLNWLLLQLMNNGDPREAPLSFSLNIAHRLMPRADPRTEGCGCTTLYSASNYNTGDISAPLFRNNYNLLQIYNMRFCN